MNQPAYAARLRSMLRWVAATLQVATNAKNPIFENDVIKLGNDTATVGEILNDADAILGEAPPAAAGPPVRTRPLPRQRKIWGTARDVDGNVMVYTEDQVAEFADACFQDGCRATASAVRNALPPAGSLAASNTQGHKIQAEEDAWGDYNAGRGPRPARR